MLRLKWLKFFRSFAFLSCLLCVHGNLAFAGQGCCSTHGGVAGCAGAKLQCNDGTLSATCSCQDGSKTVQPIPRVQDELALLEATPQEAKPYDMPITKPGPAAYVTPAEHPEIPTQGDVFPSQKPSAPSVTPIDNSPNGVAHHASESVPEQKEEVQSNGEEDGQDSKQAREQTPKSHPDDFQPIKGTSAKKNANTGEVWVKDKSAHGGEHWEVYKDQRAWEKGIRDRQVWTDGKTGRRY